MSMRTIQAKTIQAKTIKVGDVLASTLAHETMSEFENLHAQLAENLKKRQVLTRFIMEMQKSYYREEINPGFAVEQITDWQFDHYILRKEANRIMRKMFKVDTHQAAKLEDLPTDKE